AYETIDRQNPRRVIRAIEVIRLTGKPFSEQRADWNAECGMRPPAPGFGAARSVESRFAARFFGLARNRKDLGERIDARVETMFRLGLVEETRELLKRGLAEN